MGQNEGQWVRIWRKRVVVLALASGFLALGGQMAGAQTLSPVPQEHNGPNLLTNPALDPFGKIPEFKFCAAKIEKLATPVAAE